MAHVFWDMALHIEQYVSLREASVPVHLATTCPKLAGLLRATGHHPIEPLLDRYFVLWLPGAVDLHLIIDTLRRTEILWEY